MVPRQQVPEASAPPAPPSGGRHDSDRSRVPYTLDKLPAAAASAPTPTGSSIAAHVDHVRYGLSLMNRWGAGQNPFTDADWSASWTRTTVGDDEWRRLLADRRAEVERWLEALRAARDVEEIELNAMVGSVAHLAYHLRAIRQIDRAARGPEEVRPG